tara:strand:+ start:123051 stop:123893 length:843 start_codon:yes stop_codon:yes gene_type:complete
MPFIVGVGRSGTTLLRMMLDAHPEMAIPPELNWLEATMQDFDATEPDLQALADKIAKTQSWPDLDMSRSDLDHLLQASRPPLAQSFLRQLYRRYANRFDKPRSGDKTPKNLLRMPWLQQVLPEARFIHIIRDGRDVALSWKSVWIGERADISQLATSWKNQIEQGRRDSAQLTHYMEIRYEALSADPEKVLRQVCEFIELEVHPAQASFHNMSARRLEELKDMQHHRPIAAQERQDMFALTTRPPTTERIDKWKSEMTDQEIAIFHEKAGGLLHELGYEI